MISYLGSAQYSNLIMLQDEGYRRMAYIFYTATRRALAADRVKPAVPMTISGNGFCDKISGNGDYAGTLGLKS